MGQLEPDAIRRRYAHQPYRDHHLALRHRKHLTVDSWTNGLTTSTLEGDDTTSNGVPSDWTNSSTSYNNSNTWNTTDSLSSSVAISGGWAQSTVTSDTWGSGNSITTGYTSTGGTGNPDNTSDSTVTEYSGDSVSSHNETSNTLSGLNNDSIWNSSTDDTASETITENDDLTTQDNLSSTSWRHWHRSGNTSDVQNNHSFNNLSLDNGTENYTIGTSWSYNYNDQSDQTTNTSVSVLHLSRLDLLRLDAHRLGPGHHVHRRPGERHVQLDGLRQPRPARTRRTPARSSSTSGRTIRTATPT